MAEFVSSFPPPPAYFSEFASSDPQTWPEPPSPPAGDEYSMYGTVHSVRVKQQTLADFGCEQLFSSDVDRVTSLRTLSKQLVFEYLNLIDLLVKNARGKDEQIEKLRVLFINMHYLLNELRPYEARDNIKLMMKHQLEQRQQAVAEMTSVCDTVAASLAACAPLLNAHVDEKVTEGGDAPTGSVSGSLAGTASASASDALMTASDAEEALERLARIADQLEGGV